MQVKCLTIMAIHYIEVWFTDICGYLLPLWFKHSLKIIHQLLVLAFLIQGIGNYDSDIGSPRDNYSSGTKSNPSIDPNFPRDSNTSVSQQLDQQKKAYENLMDTSAGVLGNDSQRCDEEIFPSVGQELHISVPRTEFLDKKPVDKLTNLKFNTKRSTFWGSENVRPPLFFFFQNILLHLWGNK